MPEFVLGIDGGGSKTLVALADSEGRLVRTARGAGINPMDNPSWRQELDTTVAALGADAAKLAAVTAALPAYGEISALSQAQEVAIAELFGGVPASLLNDVDCAQYGAFAGGPGILVLSGSGSMSWARDTADNFCRVGGWGEAIGDEGSAYWIGRRAIALVSQDLDGRAEAPQLTAALFTHLCLDRTAPQDSLAGWVSGLAHPRSAIAALAELVATLAEAGDAATTAIVGAAAHELMRHVTASERKLPAGADLPWSYAGGTLKSPLLLSALTREVGRAPVPPRLPPVGGALLHAARHASWPVDPAWIDRIGSALASDPAREKRDQAKPENTKPDHRPQTTN